MLTTPDSRTAANSLVRMADTEWGSHTACTGTKGGLAISITRTLRW
ncbi:Uncharacterised protein [Mycobacteroides abscessus subsp. abscessus]|nr:Uncharacterised protein [Mycobacteroides abscessus subsp. abscessus]